MPSFFFGTYQCQVSGCTIDGCNLLFAGGR